MTRVHSEFMASIAQMDVQPLNTNTTLVFVVDMIKGFVDYGLMSDQGIKEIVPLQAECLKSLKKAKHLYFIDCHESDCQEFKVFPKHCIKDTSECEVVDLLKKDSNRSIKIEKNSTNGFLAPAFLNHLDQYVMPYDNFVIMGCCTDICVLQFAISLITYIHQYDLKKNVYLFADGVDTYNGRDHDVQTFNEMAITLMKNSGINIVKYRG